MQVAQSITENIKEGDLPNSYFIENIIVRFSGKRLIEVKKMNQESLESLAKGASNIRANKLH